VRRSTESERVIRQGPRFVFTRAVDPDSGRALLRVRPRDVHSTEHRARLARVVAAHRAIPDPAVAAVHAASLHGDDPWAMFDLAVVEDGESVVDRLASRRVRLPFEAAAGMIESYALGLVAAHATPHPDTGEACVLGAVGWPCFFFDASGSFVLLGFGGPLAVELAPVSPGAFVAPDVVAGARPSPGADVLSFALLQRSALSLVSLPELLARAFASLPGVQDLRLAGWLAAANHRLFVGPASQRPSADEMLTLLRKTWRRLGVRPDLALYRAHIAACLAEARPAVLRVGPGAAWFEHGGEARVSLARRASLRRILDAIVERAGREPGAALTVTALLDAGWPGERMRHESGASRVYVAVSTLRRMGLRDAIERFDDGYRVRPGVAVERAGR